MFCNVAKIRRPGFFFKYTKGMLLSYEITPRGYTQIRMVLQYSEEFFLTLFENHGQKETTRQTGKSLRTLQPGVLSQSGTKMAVFSPSLPITLWFNLGSRLGNVLKEQKGSWKQRQEKSRAHGEAKSQMKVSVRLPASARRQEKVQSLDTYGKQHNKYHLTLYGNRKSWIISTHMNLLVWDFFCYLANNQHYSHKKA